MIKILTGRQTDPLQEKFWQKQLKIINNLQKKRLLSSFLIILSLPQKLGRLIN